MEKERKRAKRNQTPSPICASKETDANFDTSVSYCLKHLNNIAVVLGSHNEDSVIQAINLMDQLRN